MSIDHLISELEAERDRLTRAIDALAWSGRAGNKRGGRRPGRHLSPTARKRIGDAMRKRWAAQKKKAKAA